MKNLKQLKSSSDVWDSFDKFCNKIGVIKYRATDQALLDFMRNYEKKN